ncbi:MAG: hypothetical protein Q6367_010100, partial [Candidatus Freyarchaeota archaeon]
MSDEELEAIRRRKMFELMQRSLAQKEQKEKQQDPQQELKEKKDLVLIYFLLPDALTFLIYLYSCYAYFVVVFVVV